MSTEATSLVFACYPGGGQERLLALALADSADKEGGNMFKSVSTLATHGGQNERTVQRYLAKMVASGWLIKCTDGLGGKGRSTIYSINPDWMTAAHFEMGMARQERRQTNQVQVPKGDSLSPFEENQRVTKTPPKGDKFEPKGDKNAPKGDTAVSPEHRTLNIEQYPLPPKGGSPVDNSKTEKSPQNIEALLADLIALHPRHDASDTPSASRALTAMVDRAGEQAAHAALRARLCAGMANDAKRWREEWGGRCPRLSKWLRGMAQLDAMPVASPSQSQGDGREVVEARARALGMDGFEQWQLAQYQRTGQTPQWSRYAKAVSDAVVRDCGVDA